MLSSRSFLAAFTLLSPTVSCFSSYAAEWIRVNYTTAGGGWDHTVDPAAYTIQAAAKFWAAEGPWTVTSKAQNGLLAPTNDPKDYLSWRPYFFPDCSTAGNTTELTPQQIWVTCPYVRRDGQFNPDARLVNDTGIFQAMSDAVFYNSLAYAITSDSTYSTNVAHFVDVWFLNNATGMNPNLNYAQLLRGPNDGTPGGSHTGVLDLKGMSKVSSGIIVLRDLKAPEWTPAFDAAMNDWCTKYIDWLTTNPLALEEKAALNNHGSFYFTQLAAIQVLVGDFAGARKTLEEYFTGIYVDQIDATGEQPLEAERTRPYHYRAYNAAAIIANSRIAEYIGYDTWDIKSKAGTTVQNAVDHAMLFPPGIEAADELWPQVGAVAAHYGDPTGKYAAFLAQNAPQYPGEAWFWYNQPFSDSGIIVTSVDSAGPGSGDDENGGGSRSSSSSNGKSGENKVNSASYHSPNAFIIFLLSALAFWAI